MEPAFVDDTYTSWPSSRSERRALVEADRTPDEFRPFANYLVAWVPPALLEIADKGIRANPERCIAWADELDTELSVLLRTT